MILRAASWIVRRRDREEWRKEWEAELACAGQIAPKKGPSSAGIRLRWRCCGAFLDAAWYRCNRGDLRHTSKHWSQTPTFLLLALVSVLLLFACASGDLPRMRSILLRPPYGDPQRIATVSRTGLISSAEWVIPYSWVEIWRRHGEALEGVAAYSWRPHGSVVMIGGRRVGTRGRHPIPGFRSETPARPNLPTQRCPVLPQLPPTKLRDLAPKLL